MNSIGMCRSPSKVNHLGSIRPITSVIIRMLRPPMSIRWSTISSTGWRQTFADELWV